MGSQIGSGLKEAKSPKMRYISHENVNFECPGPPKTGPKRVENWFPISSWTRKPSKSLLRASWIALGALSMALGAVLERSRSLPGGPGEIEGRSGEVKGRSGEHLWPAMAPGERHYRRLSINNNNQHQVMEDLNTPWAKLFSLFNVHFV